MSSIFFDHLPSQKLSLLKHNLGEPLNLKSTIQKLKSSILERVPFESCATFYPDIDGFSSLFMKLKKSGYENIAIHAGSCAFAQLGGEFTGVNILTKEQKLDALFVPLVNEDTYDKNDLKAIKKSCGDPLMIVDFSYSCDFTMFDTADIAIHRGSTLEHYRDTGLFLFNEFTFLESKTPNVYALGAFSEYFSKTKEPKEEFKSLFFDALKNELGEDVYLFGDIQKCVPNSFCTGFRGIKARDMMKALNLENIRVINGEACFLGLETPSLTLKNLGYDEKARREAISFSFEKRFVFETVAKKIAKKYRQIRALS